MFSGLFIILLPLVVGYLLPLRHSSALKLINRMLSWIVYVILFFYGYQPGVPRQSGQQPAGNIALRRGERGYHFTV